MGCTVLAGSSSCSGSSACVRSSRCPTPAIGVMTLRSVRRYRTRRHRDGGELVCTNAQGIRRSRSPDREAHVASSAYAIRWRSRHSRAMVPWRRTEGNRLVPASEWQARRPSRNRILATEAREGPLEVLALRVKHGSGGGSERERPKVSRRGSRISCVRMAPIRADGSWQLLLARPSAPFSLLCARSSRRAGLRASAIGREPRSGGRASRPSSGVSASYGASSSASGLPEPRPGYENARGRRRPRCRWWITVGVWFAPRRSAFSQRGGCAALMTSTS